MRKQVWRGAAAALIVLSGGCHLILGLDEYALDESGTCEDGIRNGNETGQDCGGRCGPCADGAGCTIGPDCASKVCSNGTCVSPTCTDDVQNGDETDLNCGGPNCMGCGAGKACKENGDCLGGSCVGNVCAASCSDGEKNGQETAIDCGGPECAGCALGDACATGGDCASGVCKGSACADFHVWSKRFGDSVSDQRDALVTTDQFGQVLITGLTNGAVDFGGGPVQGTGKFSFFAAELSPTGDHVWSKAFAGANLFNHVRGIAVGTGGVVALTGEMAGSVDFGGGSITSGNNSKRGVFVAKLGNLGQHLFSKFCGSGSGEGVASSKTLSYFITVGGFDSTLDCGGGALTSAGGSDVFILRQSTVDSSPPSGWRFGDSDNQGAESVAVDPAGNVLVAGSFAGSIDFGGGPLVALTSSDTFLAKLTLGGSVVHIWSKRIDTLSMPRLATDAGGNIVLAAKFSGTVDVGGGARSSAGANDIVVAKFDPSGNHLWSKRFGDAGDQNLTGFAVDSAGNVLLTGSLDGTVDFGGGPLNKASTGNLFVVKLDPTGAHLWSRSFGGPQGAGLSTDIAASGSENLFITGSFFGPLDLGGDPLQSPSSSDIFLAKLLTP